MNSETVKIAEVGVIGLAILAIGYGIFVATKDPLAHDGYRFNQIHEEYSAHKAKTAEEERRRREPPHPRNMIAELDAEGGGEKRRRTKRNRKSKKYSKRL